jgi:hypothetical protein
MKKSYLAGLFVLVATVAYSATTYTTNYNLAKPGDGDEGYGEALRDNFDTIDTQMKTNADSTTAHVGDTTAAHTAAAVGATPGSFTCNTQTNVQAYLDCLDGVFDPGVSGVVLLTGVQTISGVKTFTATPVFPNAASGILNTNGSGVISAGSFTSIAPLTTQGDLLVHNGSDAVRFPVGGANEVLTSDGTDPLWDAISDVNIDAAADIARTKLASGTADHVVINSGTGVLSSEAALSPVRGGTGVANNAAATLTRSGNHALTVTTTGVTGVTLPTSGTVVARDSADVLTNKDYDGGLADNTHRLTVPKGTKSNLDTLTRKEATVVYASDEDKLYVDDGASLLPVGSGAGAGGVNYVENGDSEQTAVPSAWATFDDGATATPVNGTGGAESNIASIARDTDSGDLISQTGTWRLSKDVAANGQGEGWAYDFSLKTKSDLFSSLVGLDFDYYFSASTADSVVVYLYDRDTSTLITPSWVSCGGGTTSALTVTTTTCRARLAWVSSTSDDYRLIFMVAATGTTAWDLYVDNIFVGGKSTSVGPTVSGWTSYTPEARGDATLLVSQSSATGFWRRVGDSMEVRFFVKSTANRAGSETLRISLPTGYTLNTSALASFHVVGPAGWYTGAAYDEALPIVYQTGTGSTTGVATIKPGGTTTFTVDDFDNNVEWNGKFTVPIAEWAGASNLGENSVEYACNSSTTDADDAVSFSYGPAGCQFGNFTATRYKTVQWQTPISTTDLITMQITRDGGVTWLPLGQSDTVGTYSAQGSANYGAVLTPATSTKTDVGFYAYRLSLPATFGAAGASWADIDVTNTHKYRLVKAKGGQAVGFGAATSTANGLVSRESDGSFTGTGTGFTTSPTTTIYYARVGSTVTMNVDSAISATSNATTFTITGAPSAVIPTRDQDVYVDVVNNGAASTGRARIKASTGTIEFYLAQFAAFTNSGTKGTSGRLTFTYALN